MTVSNLLFKNIEAYVNDIMLLLFDEHLNMKDFIVFDHIDPPPFIYLIISLCETTCIAIMALIETVMSVFATINLGP